MTTGRVEPERGAGALVALGTIAIALLLATFVLDVSMLVAHRLRVATAADAAALAAAPVTFRRFGASGGPEAEAARFANENGATLVSCDCRVDLSLRTRTVRVVVADQIDLVMFGRQRITAASRASYTPVS